MLNGQFRQMNSVQVRDNLVFVGERHYDPRSKALIQSVLSSVDDLEGVALEKYEPDLFWESETGIDHAEDYAFESNKSRYYIDKSIDWIHEKIMPEANVDDVISDGNKFSVEPDNDGDVAIESICDARSRVYHNHGQKAFEALYTDREKYMAENLNQIREQTDGYVVVVIGVFHIFALLDFMDLVDENGGKERIENLVYR